MNILLTKVRGCEKAAGIERIYTSGEIERDMEKRRMAEGIPYTRSEVDALHELARQVCSDAKLT